MCATRMTRLYAARCGMIPERMRCADIGERGTHEHDEVMVARSPPVFLLDVDDVQEPDTVRFEDLVRD